MMISSPAEGREVEQAPSLGALTHSSLPTKVVRDTGFGIEKVASHPARCVTGFTAGPSAFK